MSLILTASTAVDEAAPQGGGWTAKEIGGLVSTGVLILVIWLAFRNLKSPD